MEKLTLRTLGGFELSRAGGEAVVLPGKKALALFVYLALHPETLQPREHLASLLWGDRFDEQARHSLRGCLMNLRRALNDEAGLIVSEGEAVRLDLSRIDIDVAEFEALAVGDEAMLMERGADLYGGDLLHGFSIRAEAFEAWLDDERQRLRGSAVDALLRLSALHEAAGDGDAAVTAAKRAVEIDPLREDAHRALMRLHDHDGRRAEALRQYAACEQVLRRQLDVEPEAETVRLAEEIRAATERTAAVPFAWPTGLGAWPRKPRNAIAAALLVVAGVVGAWALWIPPSDPLQPGKSIVVLPFRNLSQDLAQQDLVDGITEAITNALSMVSVCSSPLLSSRLPSGRLPVPHRALPGSNGAPRHSARGCS